MSSSSASSTSADLTAITEAAFVDFGFNSDQNTVVNASDQLTLQQAEQFVQQEYKNQTAQIIAECGYRMCTLGSQSNGTLAAAGLASVCGAAIQSLELPDQHFRGIIRSTRLLQELGSSALCFCASRITSFTIRMLHWQ